MWYLYSLKKTSTSLLENRDFLNDYSVQIEDLEADSNFEVEYESNLEVYFYKKGGGVFSDNSENELDIYCNNELFVTVILE